MKANRKIAEAIQLVNEIIAKPGGVELFHLADIYFGVSQSESEEPLTNEETLELTTRIDYTASVSTVPLLTAERVDAVRFMLEYGITPNRSPEFTSATASEAKQLLLECELDVFADLVDAVALDGHSYYAPDGYYPNEQTCNRINAEIEKRLA